MKRPQKQSSSGTPAGYDDSAATRRMRRRADPIGLGGAIVGTGVFATAKDVERIRHGTGDIGRLAMGTARVVLHGVFGQARAVPPASSLQDPRFRFPPPR